MSDILKNSPIRVASHFSGIGSHLFALDKLGVSYESVFACDWDKYARATYLKNHSTLHFYEDVSMVDWSLAKSSDLFITSPPCQGFSIAGQRKKGDVRNTLFHYSHQYIVNRRPRVFILENVLGLLSHNRPSKSKATYGPTFLGWLGKLGQLVNGRSVASYYYQSDWSDYNAMFNTFLLPADCANYYLCFFKMNAKDHGIPQNRNRVFIVGFREEKDYLAFQKPKKEVLKKCLKNIMDITVSDKYYLSEKMIRSLLKHNENQKSRDNGFKIDWLTENDIAKCIRANYSKMGGTDNYLIEKNKIHQINPSTKSNGVQPYQQDRIYHSIGISPALNSRCDSLNILFSSSETNTEVAEMPANSIYQKPREQNKGGLFPKYAPCLTGQAWDRNNILLSAGCIRRLTEKECSRLMGLPESFEFDCSMTQAYKQMGNGIVVDVLEKIIGAILKNW